MLKNRSDVRSMNSFIWPERCAPFLNIGTRIFCSIMCFCFCVFLCGNGVDLYRFQAVEEAKALKEAAAKKATEDAKAKVIRFSLAG